MNQPITETKEIGGLNVSTDGGVTTCRAVMVYEDGTYEFNCDAGPAGIAQGEVWLRANYPDAKPRNRLKVVTSGDTLGALRWEWSGGTNFNAEPRKRHPVIRWARRVFAAIMGRE